MTVIASLVSENRSSVEQSDSVRDCVADDELFGSVLPFVLCLLADFGVSAELATTMSKRKTVIGTPYW